MKQEEFAFRGHGESKQAGGDTTKWIASPQNIPFSTPLGPPYRLDSVVLFATSHD